jgi:hypothetical protein
MIKVYITTVSLCNLYSYMFRHSRVIIREFTTNSLLSYILFFLIAAVENIIYKIKMFHLKLI